MTSGIATGTRLGPYEIVGWIGAGGMGEVYRARDTRLGRDVALKLIPGAASADAARLRRFEQEARAAAAIAHPNILVVYDVGVQDGVPYIVSELLEGESLRSRLRTSAMPTRRAIDIARHAAEGLAAAHDKAIVHRDVKPDNLFITTDGRVKILDFGIAKLNAPSDEPARTGLPTETSAGAVIGTTGYMSPEQVRGENVDARSDIFSLGAVLYEMIAGRAPFARETAADTMAAILNAEPPDLFAASIPAGIARVIARCLEKTREARYQSARDLAFGLEMLTGTSVTAPPAHQIRWRSLVLPALTVASLAAAMAGWMLRPGPAAPIDPLADAVFTLFTNWPGTETAAEISPDGRFVAFLADRAGEYDIWTSQVGTHGFNSLTDAILPLPEPGPTLRMLGFNADGSELWATIPERNPADVIIRRQNLLSLSGRSHRPFLGRGDITPAWSPDGLRLAFVNGNAGDKLFVAGASGLDPREIFSTTSGLHNHNPVWSSDGEWIYFVHGREPSAEMDLWRVRADGSGAEQLTRLNSDINRLASLDARTLLYISRAQDLSGPWLWAFDVQSRTSRRIISGVERYTSVSASRDGRRIVATAANPKASLWSVPILDQPAGEADVQEYAVAVNGAFAPRFVGTSLYFLSAPDDDNGLWRRDGDGRLVQIWHGRDSPLLEPAVIARDGSRIALVIRDNGHRRLMTIAPDGTDPRTLGPNIDLLGKAGQSAADWSPDGSAIVVGGDDGKGPGLFLIPANGSEAKRLTSGFAQHPLWSPTGSMILYSGELVEGRSPLRAVRPDATEVAIPEIGMSTGGYRFTPDGKSLVYLPFLGAEHFFILDLGTGAKRRLTSFSNRGALSTFDVTSDGKRIVFDRTYENGNIVLIERPKSAGKD